MRDWRVAAWLAAGFAVGMVALACGYSNAKASEAYERTLQACIQQGKSPTYDTYNRFTGCK